MSIEIGFGFRRGKRDEAGTPGGIRLFDYFSMKGDHVRHRAVGFVRYKRSDLLRLRETGKPLDLLVIGVLRFARDVPPLLAEEVIERLRVRGKTFATPGVRSRLAPKRR